MESRVLARDSANNLGRIEQPVAIVLTIFNVVGKIFRNAPANGIHVSN